MHPSISDDSTGELLPRLTVDSQIDQVSLVCSRERYAFFYWDVTGNRSRLVLGTMEKRKGLLYTTSFIRSPSLLSLLGLLRVAE